MKLNQVTAFATQLDQASWIKAALLLVFIVGTNIHFWGHLLTLLTAGAAIKTLIFTTIWVAVIVSCVIIAWHPLRNMRIAWALPISLSAFVAGAFVAIVGNPMSFADILMYWAMRADATDAVYSYWAGMIPPLLLAVCGFCGFMIKPTQTPFNIFLPPHLPANIHQYRLRISAALPLAPVVLIILATYAIGGRFTATFPVQYKSLTLLPMSVAEAMMRETPVRESVTLPLQQAPALKHVVMIVDESIAADFIDLNNNQGTTPHLMTQQEKLANFGYASSTHNCSDQSNALLRWGVGPTNFTDAFTQPTIWQYAKKAGFQTTYIDVQKREGKLQNYMDTQEQAFIDEFIQFNDVSSGEKSRDFVEKDLRTAELMRDILQRDAPHFIYVVKEGLHFPFEGKYPESESYFDNHMTLLEPIGTSRERLINSYKNGVRWATNAFFEVLLKDLNLSQTLIVYTSDHGQNLMDRGLPTHCRSVDAHYTEGLVPLFAMTTDTALLNRLQNAAHRNKNKATHLNIFPTLLDVFGYDPDEVANMYGGSLFQHVEHEQGFASGYVLDDRSEWSWNPLPETITPRQTNIDCFDRFSSRSRPKRHIT